MLSSGFPSLLLSGASHTDDLIESMKVPGATTSGFILPSRVGPMPVNPDQSLALLAEDAIGLIGKAVGRMPFEDARRKNPA